MIIFTIIGIIVVGMILFSVLDKGERTSIRSRMEEKDRELIQSQSREIVKEVFIQPVNQEGMDGLVRILQSSYSMKNVPAEISYKGSELIVNLHEPKMVSFHEKIVNVLKKVYDYSESEVSEAKHALDFMRQSGIRVWEEQSIENQILFKKAGVKKYTSLLNGVFVFALDLEYENQNSVVRCSLNPEHKNAYSITSNEYEAIISREIANEKYASALLLIRSYMDYYPEKKEKLMAFKEKVQEIYYNSDEYNNTPLPF